MSYAVEPTFYGWHDQQGGYHSYDPPSVHPTAMQYAGVAGLGVLAPTDYPRFGVSPHVNIPRSMYSTYQPVHHAGARLRLFGLGQLAPSPYQPWIWGGLGAALGLGAGWFMRKRAR